jgi:hypothetical protein
MEMKYLANLAHGPLLGVLAIAAALAGCSGDGSSSATTSASGAPAAITTSTQQPPVAPLPSSSTSSSSSNATLSWTAPTENTDGSVLLNLGGYVIHYGTVATDLTSTITIKNPGLTTYVIDNLAAGTYYFTLSATTTGGVQSVDSNEASVTIS